MINSGRLILGLEESTDDAVLCTILQEEYLLHTCFAAVGHDSLNSSRPISSPAENPTQIKQMFDTVSYDKVCLYFQYMCHKEAYTYIHNSLLAVEINIKDK